MLHFNESDRLLKLLLNLLYMQLERSLGKAHSYSSWSLISLGFVFIAFTVIQHRATGKVVSVFMLLAHAVLLDYLSLGRSENVCWPT